MTPPQDYLDGYGYAPGYPEGDQDLDGPVDPVSALVAALAAWLRGLSFQRSATGEAFGFAQVFEEWPDEEDELSAYPVASVIVANEDYDREVHGLTPDDSAGWSPDGAWALSTTSTIKLSIQVDVWAKSRVERQDVARVLSEESSPEDGTGSILLPLPRYWAQIGRYTVLRGRRWDSMESARSGEFRSTLFLEATVPEIRAKKRPPMDPRLAPVVVGPTVVVE